MPSNHLIHCRALCRCFEIFQLTEKYFISQKLSFGFPDRSVGKEYAYNAGDPGLIPGLGRSPGERKGCPLQYSGLENSMDCIVHGVANSQTELSDFDLLTYYKLSSRDLFMKQLKKLYYKML